MIAIRTRRTLKVVAIVVGSWLAVVAGMAAVFPGEHRTTWGAYTFWLWALPVILGVWFLAEAAGTWLLSRPLLKEMSSFARICLGVIATCAVVGVMLAVSHLWGSYAP